MIRQKEGEEEEEEGEGERWRKEGVEVGREGGEVNGTLAVRWVQEGEQGEEGEGVGGVGEPGGVSAEEGAGLVRGAGPRGVAEEASWLLVLLMIETHGHVLALLIQRSDSFSLVSTYKTHAMPTEAAMTHLSSKTEESERSVLKSGHMRCNALYFDVFHLLYTTVSCIYMPSYVVYLYSVQVTRSLHFSSASWSLRCAYTVYSL